MISLSIRPRSLLVSLLATCLFPWLALSARADLKFAKTEFVYNATPNEDEFKAEYTYENTGTKPVAIKEIKTFCGCLTASVDKGIVKPGEKGKLTGVFSIGKLTGTLTKQIEVMTDLKSNAVKTLDVTVKIPELVAISPEKGLNWLVGEAPVAKTVKIKVLSKAPIHVKSVTSSRPNVAHRLKTITKGREYEIVVQPTSTADVVLGFIKIVTDCKYQKHRNQTAFFSVTKRRPK